MLAGHFGLIRLKQRNRLPRPSLQNPMPLVVTGLGENNGGVHHLILLFLFFHSTAMCDVTSAPRRTDAVLVFFGLECPKGSWDGTRHVLVSVGLVNSLLQAWNPKNSNPQDEFTMNWLMRECLQRYAAVYFEICGGDAASKQLISRLYPRTHLYALGYWNILTNFVLVSKREQISINLLLSNLDQLDNTHQVRVFYLLYVYGQKIWSTITY